MICRWRCCRTRGGKVDRRCRCCCRLLRCWRTSVVGGRDGVRIWIDRRVTIRRFSRRKRRVLPGHRREADGKVRESRRRRRMLHDPRRWQDRLRHCLGRPTLLDKSLAAPCRRSASARIPHLSRPPLRLVHSPIPPPHSASSPRFPSPTTSTRIPIDKNATRPIRPRRATALLLRSRRRRRMDRQVDQCWECESDQD